jgi:hypothetical protein
MVIGSLWLRADDRKEFKSDIHKLRNKHKIGGEFKWRKVSPSKIAFYKDLISWFEGLGTHLRFRCIAVDQAKVNLIRYHDNDQELGFYKFYYQMLHHWIMDFNEYAVFCDFKSSRRRDRLSVLKECLSASNLSSNIVNVQAIQSHNSMLIQLVDVLTGAAAARLNDTLTPNSAKHELVFDLEQLLERRIQHTSKNEQKFNVFEIDLGGGW